MTTLLTVKARNGVEYIVDELSEFVFTVTWKSKTSEGKRYARTRKEAERIARNLADLSNGLARSTR